MEAQPKAGTNLTAKAAALKPVELTLLWSGETPSWPYFPNPVVEAFHRHPREHLNSLIVKTAMHTGTHVDAPLHLQSGKWDLSQIPLDRLYGTGVVIDLSQHVDNYSFITLEMVQSLTPDAIQDNDIVVLHTGWHRYSWCGPQEDETRYFAQHPGPTNELVDFFVEKNMKWVGTDCPAFEHPLNTAIRDMRPDLVAEMEQQTGKTLEQLLPRETMLYAHKTIAANNQMLVECLGGDIEQVLNSRLILGAFPWRFKRGEASIARVVAFVEE